MSARYVVAVFGEEIDLLEATAAVRRAEYPLVDVYTPYAVHGIEKAMGLRPSRLPWACFLAGLLGCLLTLYFEYWTSWLDWPINVGGKPFDSLPAFIPIAFEVTVLFAGLGVVAALFIRCGLWPGKKARTPTPRVTNDRFALVVRLDRADHSASDLRTLLARYEIVEFDERIGEEAP